MATVQAQYGNLAGLTSAWGGASPAPTAIKPHSSCACGYRAGPGWKSGRANLRLGRGKPYPYCHKTAPVMCVWLPCRPRMEIWPG
jgi:hypothetical protein